MNGTLLLVEDEAAIADTVVYALKSEGFDVRWIVLGRDALAAVHEDPDIALVILDIGLPDMDGFEVCRVLRGTSDIPILFLTARSQEVDRIVGLEMGADDYVGKPFSPRELAARVKAILRRTRGEPRTPTVAAQGFTLDRQRARITYCGHRLALTRYEYLILVTLLDQPERVFSRGQIKDRVWPQPEVSLERSVDTHIKGLRAKLREAAPERDPIVTHRGLGYSVAGPVHEV